MSLNSYRKMHIRCSLVAIFIVFILCVHCENGANYNEIKKIHVPSAPQNLTAHRVYSDEIYLSWVPPTNFTIYAKRTQTQADEPEKDLSVIPKNEAMPADSPESVPETPPETRDWYSNDKQKYNDEYSNSDILNDYRSKRELKNHRRRRQDNVDQTPIEVVKKAVPSPHKDMTQIAYVLYYEQGQPMNDAKPILGVPSSSDVKRLNAFPSDLGLENREQSTKNLTLLNTAGILTKAVGFRLRNLRSFTPYKIWVRAFYNFSLVKVQSSDLLEHLGPQSEPLYVLTDVRAPSPPIVLNLTCEQSSGNIYLQWRQPMVYDNSLDLYVVTLRRLPEPAPRTRLTMHTSRDEIETTISVTAELWNVTRYEVKIYAATLSVAKTNQLINGSESPPEEVSSEWCSAHSEAMSPDGRSSSQGVTTVALLATLPILVIVALALAAVYWRCRSRLSKCISAAYSYLEEGGERAQRAPLNSYKKPAAAVVGAAPASPPPPARWRPPRMAAPAHPARPPTSFVHHVASLHQDGDIGFSKEYEIVVSKSAALGHTSHYSHRPENRLKNRYLNITAYDHSRVCVSTGSQCGAPGCAGGTGGSSGAPCGYVNANYIDGIKPEVDEQLKRLLQKKEGKERQPSVKQPKPPPVLAEGIEAAFLNIEFSGVAEPERSEDSDTDSDDDDERDVVVDVDGTPTPVKLEWLVWRRRYIATQGPTPATLDAFWLMVCQHDVHTVVMITNLVERGRRKCDMYWPSGGRGSTAQFGQVRVTLLSELVRAAYTVRHLKAQWPCGSGSTERVVVQYHYTMWPDHGTPRHPLAVLPFVRRAAAAPKAVLVHCSAGVGRTGTFIVLDAQLNQLKLTGTLSPLGFLCRARTQRNHLVQTEEQYVFVHDALLEHVRSGDTAIPFEQTREYLVKLLQPISEEELAVLDFINTKSKSQNDLTNGYEHNETASVKSKEDSQVSIKTDDVSVKSSSVKEGDDDKEDVYDLTTRSTDTYNKKMAAYNNMSEEEKEEVRRANRAENYAILERMRSLSNRSQPCAGPPPASQLEKQYQLISRSCTEPAACARAPHNLEKNRPGAALPSDAARVLLVPKPGVEGSEYINASWVCGLRRLREYCVAQAPPPAADLWRLLWDHTAQLVLTLDDGDEDCEIFWPTEEEKELYVANFRASFVSKDIYIAHRKADRKTPAPTPVEPEKPEPKPETNGYSRRQESDCADDECLIPENSSPILEPEPAYRFDRTELRLERLSTGSRDLTSRKSIANGDLFSSFSEKKSGPKSPRSPSKMSLKNFKLSSPTKFKFPDWGSRGAGSPPNEAPPPPPVAPTLSVEEESELRRPCYYFEKVNTVPEGIPLDRVIEVTNVSVHSLQDDYQLNVKFIKCTNWFESNTTEYKLGKPDDNELVKIIRESTIEEERQKAIDDMIEPFRDTFGLIEFVAGCQMEYKNGPVVVVDKFGDWKALSFCILSAACGGARDPKANDPNAQFTDPSEHSADIYCASSLAAHARCSPAGGWVVSPGSLLAMYGALAQYGTQVARLRSNEESQNGEPTLTLVS